MQECNLTRDHVVFAAFVLRRLSSGKYLFLPASFETDVLVKADKLPDVFFLYRFEGISTGLPTPFSPTPVLPTKGVNVQFCLLRV